MLIHTINEVRVQVQKWKAEGFSVGFVPTMGALHTGHLSLIENSIEKCDRTVVSIFVNPIQFGAGEDFSKYPRTLDEDYQLCMEVDPSPQPSPARGEGALLVFAPNAEEMYGQDGILSNDFLTYVVPPYFYTDKLCGKSRVGHFDGVCTVVNKFFNIVQPDYAFFGQKDAQQLIIINKMVKDLNIPVEIVSCPIVRDENGLALSSRNKYLSENQKNDALVLSKILFNIKSCYNKNVTDISYLTETAYGFLNSSHALEYLEFRDKTNLEEKTVADDNTIVLIALKIGDVRLIDNILLK